MRRGLRKCPRANRCATLLVSHAVVVSNGMRYPGTETGMNRLKKTRGVEGRIANGQSVMAFLEL